MAGPAVDADLFLLVAVEAPAHLEVRNAGDQVHGGDVAVAGGAVQPCTHMHHVGEIDVVRQGIDPDPGDRLILLSVCLQLRDLEVESRMACLHAERNGRDAGSWRFGSGPVAEEAMDAIVSGMFFMAEWKGLQRRALMQVERQVVHQDQAADEGGNGNSRCHE